MGDEYRAMNIAVFLDDVTKNVILFPEKFTA